MYNVTSSAFSTLSLSAYIHDELESEIDVINDAIDSLIDKNKTNTKKYNDLIEKHAELINVLS